MSPENIDKAIDKWEYLYVLYKHQKHMSPENIDKAIEKGEYLYVLYEYQKNMSPENIDHAIEKGKYLDILYEYQKSKITPEQKARIEKKLNKKLSNYNTYIKPLNILPFNDLNIKLSRYITSGIEDILPNLIQMIKKQKPDIQDHEAESTIRHFWDILPNTVNKTNYITWLIKIWLSNNGYIDENRAISLINTINQVKTTFPNDFPSNFNINDYRTLDELEDFLDPWITRLDTLQEKHINKEQSKELGQIVYQKGEYKILRIDDPEDIVKFQELNDLHCWCIQHLHKAKEYGTAWFLYRRNSIVGVYTVGEEILRNRNDKYMQDPKLVRVFVDFKARR